MFESLVARSRAAVRDGLPFCLLPELQFAWTAAQRAVRPADPHGWLTTLIGPRGAGKTKLVSRVLCEAVARRPQFRFVIQSAGDWVQLLQTKPIPPNSTWPGVIIIEDADRTLADLDDANLLAHWLDELHRSGTRVLLTLSEPPGQATALSPRLVSRLHAGLSARMPTLSVESRRQFVREWLVHREWQAVPAVIHGVADLPPGTCRSLSKQLERLVRTAKRRSTIESLAALQIGDDGDPTATRPSLAVIAAEIATEFGVPVGELRSESREQALQLPRRCAMWLAHEVRWPMAQIGRYFGRRTHASVSYSCRELSRYLDDTPTLRERLQRLQMRLVENPLEDCG